MRSLIWAGVLTGCAVSPESPVSNAMLSGAPTVHSSRANQGDTFHGAPLHKWTIILSTSEGCAGDDQASVEINTPSGTSDMPLGVIAIRADENTIAVLPSAFVKITGATVTGGTVTIESSAGAFMVGSWAAQTSLGDSAATFGAPACN